MYRAAVSCHTISLVTVQPTHSPSTPPTVWCTVSCWTHSGTCWEELGTPIHAHGEICLIITMPIESELGDIGTQLGWSAEQVTQPPLTKRKWTKSFCIYNGYAFNWKQRGGEIKKSGAVQHSDMSCLANTAKKLIAGRSINLSGTGKQTFFYKTKTKNADLSNISYKSIWY